MSFDGYHDIDAERSIRRIIAAEEGRIASTEECRMWVRAFVKDTFHKHKLGDWAPGDTMTFEHASIVGREFLMRLEQVERKRNHVA